MLMLKTLSILALYIQLASSLTYQQVFRDDFTVPWSIDRSKWNIVSAPSTVNNELQYYTGDDVWQESGFIFLRSQRRSFLDGRQYTSGRVDTKDKFQFLYGEVEWRAQLPRGKGIWPALWLVQFQCPAARACTTWPPEIDVIEARGDRTNLVTFANHFGRFPNNGYHTGSFSGPDFTQGFHTFKVIWDPNQIVWFVDGVERYKVTDTSRIPNEPMYLIMNVAVGGDYPGSPDGSTPFPTHMIIDYVTVHRWQ